MSPDRTTLTRAEAIRRRKEEEQKQREKTAPTLLSRLKPVEKPKPAAKPRLKLVHVSKPAVHLKAERPTSHPISALSANRLRHRYDVAMSSPYARSYERSRVPSLSMPKIGIGPRLLSFALSALFAVGLYYLLALDPFLVRGASILGNSRVSVEQIGGVLGIANQPVALLNPGQIEYNILESFPEIATAEVEINLPSQVVVTVSERQPVAVWQQDGQVTWVDAQGYAFPPRGEVPGLVIVTSTGAPPTPATFNIAQKIGARPFLTPDLSKAIVTLAPLLPEGATLVFDPTYGLGWSDPRGWKVFFGHSNSDVSLKYQVYQAMLDYFTREEIQPALISVEYPNAPFYRVEQ